MTTRILLTATLLALATAAATAAAADRDGTRAPHARFDANGDGAIDRDEAAAHARLAGHFDRLDADGDGRLVGDELPAHRGHRHRPRHHGIDGIARLDADGDGRLSRTELEQGRDGARRGRGAGRLVEQFDAIDADRDGHIVRAELRAWHERQRPQREAEMAQRFDARFAEADLNGDGRLSRVEVEEKMPRVGRGFAWMDEDRDGFLAREELAPRRMR